MKHVFFRTQDPELRTQRHPRAPGAPFFLPSPLLHSYLRRFLASFLPSPLLHSSLRPLDSGGALPDSIRQAAPDRGRKNPACAAGGFTLIETALAMLAIGLGLLAVFGLGRLGLQSAKETGHDRRCVMMADAVFETLREYNARFVDEARTNGMAGTSWVVLWQQAFNNQIPFPEIAGMSASPNIPLVFTGSDSFAAAFDKDNLSLANWNPLYSLSGEFTYRSTISGAPEDTDAPYNCLHIKFVVHPDGHTYSSDHRIFSTVVYDSGGLP